MKIQFYRHKDYKDLYLKRNFTCGGSKDTKFYDVTKNWKDAYESLEREGDEFLYWVDRFPETKTTAVLTKKMSFDGYEGTLAKTLELSVKDFELVTFVEAGTNEQQLD